MRNLKYTDKKLKKTSFLKNVVVLVVAHIFIKIIGVINKIYLTNKQGFGDEGNAIYSSAFQIYAEISVRIYVTKVFLSVFKNLRNLSMYFNNFTTFKI